LPVDKGLHCRRWVWEVATVACRDERYDTTAAALLARLGLEASDQETASSSSSGPS
jgi:hypothetical protein